VQVQHTHSQHLHVTIPRFQVQRLHAHSRTHTPFRPSQLSPSTSHSLILVNKPGAHCSTNHHSSYSQYITRNSKPRRENPFNPPSCPPSADAIRKPGFAYRHTTQESLILLNRRLSPLHPTADLFLSLHPTNQSSTVDESFVYFVSSSWSRSSGPFGTFPL
jgi:hypothetical protein